MGLAAASWRALGCEVQLVVTDPAALTGARASVEQDIRDIDLACSRFREDSELEVVHRYADQVIPVSRLLAGAVAAALDAAAATGGDVDPTVGSAMCAVGYDRDFAEVLPVAGPVRIIHRPVPGWRRVELDVACRTLRLPRGVRLDLGATAKALTADMASRRVHQMFGCGVLVGLGGDIAVAGPPPQQGWPVRVQDVTGAVDERPAGPSTTVSVYGGGLATSSTTARQWVRGGQLMHHILDPRSGVPISSRWRTVTVAAGSCLAANIASTASIVRGEPAVGWLEGRGLAARFVDNAGRLVTTSAWPDRAAMRAA
jgi:thiamine biosynthesis lipoprotein